MTRFPCALAAAALLVAPLLPAAGTPSGACSLLDPQDVSTAIGLPVVNVSERDRGSYTSCSFETDDWMRTVGLIHFPGLGDTTPGTLAEELRADLERDEVEYADFTVEDGFDAPAIYYRSPEGDLHTLVAQPGGDRVIVTAGTRDAAVTLARTALNALAE